MYIVQIKTNEVTLDSNPILLRYEITDIARCVVALVKLDDQLANGEPYKVVFSTRATQT